MLFLIEAIIYISVLSFFSVSMWFLLAMPIAAQLINFLVLTIKEGK